MRRRWFLALVPVVLVACATGPGVRTRSSATLPSTSGTGPSTSTVPPPSGSPTPGDGIGDSLFPSLGNPGIDVEHYDLDLRYDPASDRLAGGVVLDLVLTEARGAITLDAVGPQVSSVSLDGAGVPFRQDDEELRITLPDGTPVAEPLRLAVEYAVTPRPVESPGGIISGWFHTEGGSYVLNEPDGARTWLPCNDHPADKATYRIAVTVPSGMTAVANGALLEHTSLAGGERWVWAETQPMATYLMQVLTGDYELIEGEGPRGLPLLSAVLRADVESMQPYLETIDDQLIFFEQWFGPYPLDRYGIAMTDSTPGMAMEEQGRSLFSRDDFDSGVLGRGEQFLLSHELAHQWFGNAVTPARWRDIWLNESFATYAEWMWLEHTGFTTVADEAASALDLRAPRSAADPAVSELFDYNSYDGGAVVLHALRLELGDDEFFEVLRSWVGEHSGRSVTTEQFVEWAELVSGRSLSEFFSTWLYADLLPDGFPA